MAFIGTAPTYASDAASAYSGWWEVVHPATLFAGNTFVLLAFLLLLLVWMYAEGLKRGFSLRAVGIVVAIALILTISDCWEQIPFVIQGHTDP